MVAKPASLLRWMRKPTSVEELSRQPRSISSPEAAAASSCEGAAGAATAVSTLNNSLPWSGWVDAKKSVPSAAAIAPTPLGPGAVPVTGTVPAAVPSLVHSSALPVPLSPWK